jgi:hypothetical protein
VNSQRFTQGEIDNFDVRVRVVVGDAILEALRLSITTLTVLETRGWKQAHKTNAAGNFASFDAKFAMPR